MKEETKRIVALHMNNIMCQLYLVHSADQMLFDSNLFVAKSVKLLKNVSEEDKKCVFFVNSWLFSEIIVCSTAVTYKTGSQDL